MDQDFFLIGSVRRIETVSQLRRRNSNTWVDQLSRPRLLGTFFLLQLDIVGVRIAFRFRGSMISSLKRLFTV